MKLFTELRRRKVFRVAVVYAATTFVVLQAADLMLPRLAVPDWAMTLVVVLAVLGFPIALVLAWALELTPDGVRVTEARAPTGGDAPLPSLLGKRTVAITALLVVLGIGLGAGWLLKPGGGSEAVEGVADDAPSIAVLAFADLSPEGDQEYFADGIAEEILNALVRVEGLKVAGRTSSFHFKGREQDLRAIGDTLGVGHILEGSVRKQGERVRITAQLIRSDDGFHLWSDSYDGDLGDVFELQERIARAITDELRVVLRGGQREQLVRPATNDPEAYALYLEATGIYNRRDGARFPEAVTKLEEALRLDPDFARAHARLALIHVLSPQYVAQVGDRAANDAERHARRAMELDPALAEPHAVLGLMYMAQRRFTEARAAYERALELDPADPNTMFAAATNLWQAGYLERSIELLDRVLAIDPLLPNALLWRSLAYRENVDNAERLLLRAQELGISFVGLAMANVHAQHGRTADAIRSMTEGLGALMPGFPTDFVAVLARGIYQEGEARAAALRRIDAYLATEPPVLAGGVLAALVWLGEPERARILGQDRPSSNDALFLANTVWGPAGRDFRRLPGFAEFARRFGLAELWGLHGPPDMCRRVAPLEYVCE